MSAIVTADKSLAAAADRIRIAVHDRSGFDCSLAYGTRPDPILPRIVVSLDEEHAELSQVPAGDRVVIVDLLQADGGLVGTGCVDDVVVQTAESSAVAVEIFAYPKVVATIPEDGERFVSPARAVIVVFNDRMDPTSVADALEIDAEGAGDQPTIRRAKPVDSDVSGRTFAIELPFGLEFETEYRLYADAPITSLHGLPLETFEPKRFTTDGIVDLERDLSAAMVGAVGSDCRCTGVEGAKGLIKRIAPAGSPMRFLNWPFVVRSVELTRDRTSHYTNTMNDAGLGDCAIEITVDATHSPQDDAGAAICTVTAQFTVAPADCYCAVNDCEPPFDTTIAEPACSD